MRAFRLGFLLNPYAGVGGPAAWKGSDDPALQARAQSGDLPLTAHGRALTFLRRLQVPDSVTLTLVTVPGAMGADAIAHAVDGMDAADATDTATDAGKRAQAAVPVECVDYRPCVPSSAEDTVRAAAALAAARVDLLVFVGGDGTARDICRAVSDTQAVLGVPAGVKMHSGVYAINPQSAATLVNLLLAGVPVDLTLQPVRDIDEPAFRQGLVRSRHYGELLTPEESRFVQSVKQGGLAVEALVLADLAASLHEDFTPDTLVVVGPGSTTWHLMENWGLEGTLLGVDLVRDGRVLGRDLDAHALATALAAHTGPVRLVITAIGGQGHVLGRGNQQLSPAILRRIGRDNLRIVATGTKLATLRGRPLLLDTGDAQLDRDWQGYIPVETGYRERLWYPLGQASDGSSSV